MKMYSFHKILPEVFTLSYHITYDHPHGQTTKRTSSRFTLPLLFVLSISAFIIITFTYWTEGKRILMDFLFPKCGQITGQAIETFAEELQNGIPVSDAINHFCREIIQYAPSIH